MSKQTAAIISSLLASLLAALCGYYGLNKIFYEYNLPQFNYLVYTTVTMFIRYLLANIATDKKG